MASKRSIRAAIELTLRNLIVILSIPMMLGAFACGGEGKELSKCKARLQKYEREFQAMLWTALGYAICKMGVSDIG